MVGAEALCCRSPSGEGIDKKTVDFYGCVCVSNEDFVARYIDHHENAVPGLADAYAAVCSGKLPALV